MNASVDSIKTQTTVELLEQLSPKNREMIADMVAFLADESPATTADTPATEAPAAPILPDYVIAQIIMPLAAILITKVIDPIDMYQQKYQFSEIVDWMADVLPTALNECDSVALIGFLEKSIG